MNDYYGMTAADIVAADEEREHSSQCAAERMAHAKRMARNGSSTHPDLREPDYQDGDDEQ